jgi:hypothetical protein
MFAGRWPSATRGAVIPVPYVAMVDSNLLHHLASISVYNSLRTNDPPESIFRFPIGVTPLVITVLLNQPAPGIVYIAFEREATSERIDRRSHL